MTFFRQESSTDDTQEGDLSVPTSESLNLLPSLSNDFLKLLESENGCDVTIRAFGRSFRAHSWILKARSPLFARIPTNELSDWEFNKLVELENTSVGVELNTGNVFNEILGFIYGGNFNLKGKTYNQIIACLLVVSLLELEELCDRLQDHLINKFEPISKSEFVNCHTNLEKYIVKVFEIRLLQKLRTFYLTQAHNIPEIFFKPDIFRNLSVKIIEDLIKREDLNLPEVKIWDLLIQWVVAKAHLPDDVSLWTSNQLILVKYYLRRLIPHIRFFQIPAEDFDLKVVPFRSLLSEGLFRELISFHIRGVNPSKVTVLPARGKKNTSIMVSDATPVEQANIETPEIKQISVIPDSLNSTDKSTIPPVIDLRFFSSLLNQKHMTVINRWLRRKNAQSTSQFTLLLKGSRDNFSVSKFHESCDEKGSTVVLVKVKGSSTIVGGYNPLNWLPAKQVIATEAMSSFIFSFNSTTNAFSRVKSMSTAIYNGKSCGPWFGGKDDYGDLKFDPAPETPLRWSSKRHSYEHCIIKKATKSKVYFEAEDVEIYKVID